MSILDPIFNKIIEYLENDKKYQLKIIKDYCIKNGCCLIEDKCKPTNIKECTNCTILSYNITVCLEIECFNKFCESCAEGKMYTCNFCSKTRICKYCCYFINNHSSCTSCIDNIISIFKLSSDNKIIYPKNKIPKSSSSED